MITSQPFRSRVLIITCDTDEHYYWTDAEEAKCFVGAGLAEPVIEPFAGMVQMIRLTVTTSELRDQLAILTVRDRKPAMRLRMPLSSSGGGDLGLAPLLGRHRSLNYGSGPPK